MQMDMKPIRIVCPYCRQPNVECYVLDGKAKIAAHYGTDPATKCNGSGETVRVFEPRAHMQRT